MKISDQIENSTRAQGFGPQTAQTARPKAPTSEAPSFDAGEGVADAQEHASAISRVAQDALRGQLTAKVTGLESIENMLSQAAVAIAQREQNVVSGVYLESELAALRQEYLAETAVDQAAVTVEYEALQSELLPSVQAPKRTFPNLSDTLKRITPAQKARLDQAVLGPAD